MRQTEKLKNLMNLIRSGHGERGIYSLAAAAGRPYRRVYDQVKRLAAEGRVILAAEPQGRSRRAHIRVRPADQQEAPKLAFNRAWSRPSGGLDPETLIAQVISRPTFDDLLTCTQRFGISRVWEVYENMVEDMMLSPGAAAATARMLTNIEVGRARAAGLH